MVHFHRNKLSMSIKRFSILHYLGLEYYNHHTHFAKAQSIKTMAELSSLNAMQPKKGKNFDVEEKWQLYNVFLNMSEDPIVGIGQKSKTFWDHVSDKLNVNRLVREAQKLAWSFEIKWT